MPNKIVGFRTSIGKTQADFAKLLNITQGTYSKKEKNKNGNEFSLSEIKILVDYLKTYFPDITADELFFT